MNGKMFVSRVVTGGPAQVQFTEKIGKGMGQCIQGKELGRSFTKGEKLRHIKQCMIETGVKKGMTIGTIDPQSYYHRLKEGKVGGGQPAPTAARD